MPESEISDGTFFANLLLQTLILWSWKMIIKYLFTIKFY